MRLDVALSTSAAGAATRARELAGLGVDGAFSFENAHDPFLPIALAAAEPRLELMTNVAIAFPRSPLHLAATANDLHDLTQGRFRLGLGSQVKAHIENRYGARWVKPVAQMREWVGATKAILAHWHDGTPLRFEGTYTRHTLMTPRFHPGVNPFGVPKILVGALGPRMSEMAAEVADGILIMPFNSGRHMEERTLPAIDRGLARSGRTRSEFEVIAEVIVGVGRNDKELEAAMSVRNMIAFYASTPAYKPVLDVHGWGDLQPELNILSKRDAWSQMAELITDEMVTTIAVHGTPAEVAWEIVARFGDCQRACAYFPGYRVDDELIRELACELKSARERLAASVGE